MISEILRKEKCSGCRACAEKCPTKCIEMKADEEGFSYPFINREKCVRCGLCEKICPVLNKKSAPDGFNLKAYAAINQNEDIRLKSSSGGIFTLIAEQVIDNGGAVFGAAFGKEFGVIHTFAETKEELKKFRGSKYVQSDIGDAYKIAKEFLECGKEVLFSGTPCQIGGLNFYLGKRYENLITQDIVCHGVPSPMVWRRYIEYRESVARASASKIFFRDKKYGWKNFSMSFGFSDGKIYTANLTEDFFMKAFLNNLCLRPSCYNCSFKGVRRNSDITLADFWGVQDVLPEIDDDKGVSLLIINSDKGQKILNGISDKIFLREVEIDRAISYNISMVQSVPKNRRRKKFIKAVKYKRFDSAVDKYYKIKLSVRLKSAIKSILKKIKKPE